MSDELTPKQAAFVREYLVDHNGSAAAIRAGYAKAGAEVTASKLLRIPKVAAALAAGESKATQRAEKKADDVRRRIEEIAFADPDEVDPLEELRGRRRSIRFEHVLKALELLGKIQGLFKEHVQHDVNITVVDPYAEPKKGPGRG